MLILLTQENGETCLVDADRIIIAYRVGDVTRIDLEPDNWIKVTERPDYIAAIINRRFQ